MKIKYQERLLDKSRLDMLMYILQGLRVPLMEADFFCEPATIAQKVERILGKDEVSSSTLLESSTKNPVKLVFTGFFAVNQVFTFNINSCYLPAETLIAF